MARRPADQQRGEQKLSHAHFVCESCGVRIEAPDAMFRGSTRAAKSDLGFSIDPRPVAILGRCANCSERLRRRGRWLRHGPLS